MKSNKLSLVDDPQPGLPLPSSKPPTEVDIEAVRKQPSLNRAVALCVSYSGFECDKEIYEPLGIDAGHWTRICNGSAHFPLNKLEDLMNLCRNEIPMLWLADRRGYELVKKKSRLEQELDDAHKQLAEAQLEVRVLRDALKA